MKRFIQLFLFFIIILIAVFFYKKYFFKKDISDGVNNISNNMPSIDNKNNVIKNLKYEIKLNDKSEYIISSELSEITNKNNIEIVLMKKVKAIFIDSNNAILTVTSDYAEFNSSVYDTSFRENVKVTYLNHFIYSEKLDLNLSKNNVIIYDNAIYQGDQGKIKADNMVLDLITKNIEIFMDNSKNKITGSAN